MVKFIEVTYKIANFTFLKLFYDKRNLIQRYPQKILVTCCSLFHKHIIISYIPTKIHVNTLI